MKLFLFLAAICTFASTALANPNPMDQLGIQEQLDLMRLMIERQALRIDELEQQAEARQLEDDHARRLSPAAKKPAAMTAADFDSMKGVRVKADSAVVTLGKNSDVAFVRTGAKQAAFVGDISFAGKVNSGDLSAASVKVAKDLTANGRVTTKEIKINGGIRVMDDLVLSGPNHRDPGTVGYTYASGVLKPGQSSPANHVNPNSWSGNGKISITICSIHTEGENKDGAKSSHHAYKVYWNAHGQGYNDYGPMLLNRLKDGNLVIEANRDINKFGNPGKTATGFHASGCVFRNKDKKQTAFWIVKQLPLTTFISTRHAAMKTGPWAI